MNFQMCSQIVCSNRCKVVLRTYERFSPELVFKCLLNRFKVLLRESQYLTYFLLEGGDWGPGAQNAAKVLTGGDWGPGAQIAAMVPTCGDLGPRAPIA